jgi:hypothetical protein
MIRFFLSAFFLFFSGNMLYSQSRPEWGAIFKSIDAEVQQHSTAYGNLQEATEDIGHRLTGSAQGAKAETYAYELLKSY